MTQYNDYIKYFEKFAALFLNHTSEEKHFFRAGLEEYLNGLQNNVNYPALLLDSYDFEYIDNGNDDVSKKRTIAFMLIEYNEDTEDYERYDTIMNECELIIDEIYNRIRQDIKPSSQCEFLKYAVLEATEITPLKHPINGTAGYYATFELLSPHNVKS